MSFTALFSEIHASGRLPGTEDVLVVGLPLLRQLQDIHANGQVSGLGGLAHVQYRDGALGVDPNSVKAPVRDDSAIHACDPDATQSGIVVTEHLATDERGTGFTSVSNAGVLINITQKPEHPVLVVGYRAWEQLFGHHDSLTDIHLAGLLLASYATGKDLDEDDQIEELADHRRHLLRLNPNLHPVVADVLSSMIDPHRAKRPTDLASVNARLENHRDIPADLDLDAAYQNADSPSAWRPAVLGHLKERVFDLTRRNRALYYRASASTVGLTEASVPLMLDIKRIRPKDLLTWNESVSGEFAKGKPVVLSKWCRFEESPHVPPVLDKLMSSERKMRAEFGFSRLRLIIAFLRWTDPETQETINSPLLLIPAELKRKKGVKPLYHLQVEEEAEVNAELRHLLEVRFGIALPDSIEPTLPAIRALVRDLETKVQSTDPAVVIDVIETPRVTLIHQRAKLRLDAYRRRRASAQSSSGKWRRQDHSYDASDWRPLGLALFQRFVASPELPLRQLTDAPLRPRAPDQLSDKSANATRESTVYTAKTSDANRHRWEVDLCAVTLASIGSKRTSLTRDYDELLGAESQAHPPFDQLFSPEPRRHKPEPVASIGTDQLLVLPADDAQAKAVRRAVRGDSFIIQGPPGTGKSQTITNLIAGLVGEGKRVLFVCEKRAALDVVANRLDQVGLGHLTATIHDSQLDRREFIKHLSETYDSWIEPNGQDPGNSRKKLLNGMNQAIARLDAMSANLSDASVGVSVRELIERITRHRLNKIDAATGDIITTTGVKAKDWLAARAALDQVTDALTDAGHASELARNSALMTAPTMLASKQTVAADSTAPSTIERVDVVKLVNSIASQWKVGGAELASSGVPLTKITLAALPALAADTAELAEHPGALKALDPESTQAKTLVGDIERHESLITAAAANRDVIERWSQPLELADAKTALGIAEQREGSFFSFLNGSWRSVKKVVGRAYRFDAHQIRPSFTQVLSELVKHLQAEQDLSTFESDCLKRWGVAQPEAVVATVRSIQDGPLAAIDNLADFDCAAAATSAATLQAIAESILHAPSTPLDQVISWAKSNTTVAPAMERTLLTWRELADTDVKVLRAALQPGASLPAIERAILEQSLQGLINSGAVSGLSNAELELTIERLATENRELLQLNGEVVAHRARQRFREHLDFTEQSMAGRSEGDKAFKRSFNAGRKVLENEFRKKMRHKAIRELASGDPGLVVQDLAPIWLMSPLSVSDTLPVDANLFDAVVFDEASQIPVEDAVPSVFRAPQIIVVGDRMQMPPTRFFSSDSDEEGEVIVDADGHNLMLSLDADSFLTQSNLTLDSALLNWHYRSRFESLIAYSNTAFYDASLATIPDRTLPSSALPPIVVTEAEQGNDNAATVLERPISFHKMQNGVYQERRNEAEAQYIAELVRSLLANGSNHTIGVVAFSEAQQGEIESALSELAIIDSEFAMALEAEQERTDGDEFVGLIVKNLENVQGDERDIIIMSVCYGANANGKIRMNFGPINQSGGERRLNVIFSRAKRHMVIVSSIDGTDITNTHNTGAAHLGRFLKYAAAESVCDEQASVAALSALVPREENRVPDRQRSAVIEELSDALRARGLEVDTQVGRSGFQIDLAIRGDGAYQLGIIIDPAAEIRVPTHSRYVAEAGVLAAFGWPISRIVVTDWWEDSDQVVNQLIQAVNVSKTG